MKSEDQQALAILPWGLTVYTQGDTLLSPD